MILIMIIPSSFYAMEPLGDTGMFVNNTAMVPNVLIILDNSFDMNEKICSQAYNKTTNYCSQGCNNVCKYVNESIYYKEDFSDHWSLLTDNISNLESGCTDGIKAALNAQGFYDPYDDACVSKYGDHTVCLNSHLLAHCRLECDYWQCMCGYHRVATGHYLNFKYCNKYSDPSCPSRYDYARQRLFEIVNDLGIDKTAPAGVSNQLMKLGIMSFATVPHDQYCRIWGCETVEDKTCGLNKNEQCQRNYMGAYVVAPIGSGYGSCKAIPGDSDFQRALNEVTLESSATAGMPLAEGLAEAGLYFAGQPSWSFRRYGKGYKNRDYSVPQYISDHFNPSSYKSQFIDESTMTYYSPINWRCQKNYIILLTAGNPKQRTEDGVFRAFRDNCAWSCNDVEKIADWNLFTGNKWRPDSCQGYMKVWDAGDAEQCLPIANTGTSDWDASDVAGFLYSNDILGGKIPDGPKGCNRGDKTTYFNDPDYPKQNVITYVIGFSDASDYGRDLMKRTAQKGGSGNYYSITDQHDLDAALTEIFTTIMKNSAEYVSPVVPVSRQNGIYAGDSVYLGQFKTASGVPWIGNLKKYWLDTKGNILQKDGTVATCCDVDGNCRYTAADVSCTDSAGNVYRDMIKDSSTSSWSVSGDGNNVERGAAGRIVKDATTANPTTGRKILTSKYTSSTLIDITTLTKEDLGLATDTEKDEILSYVTGLSVGSVNNTETKKLRTWYMGDIIHSRPVIVENGSKYLIYVGDNSGQLHCFEDDLDKYSGTRNANGQYMDGQNALSEKWSFIPGEYLTKLSKIKNDRYPLYFVDGSPVIHDAGTERLITFGFRRGGGSYITLKIGDVDSNGNFTETTPAWKWTYPNGDKTIGGKGEAFGQSWLRPIPCNILTANGPSKMLILAGGYDPGAEDANDPGRPDMATNADTKGRGLYAVYADTGNAYGESVFVNDSELPISGSIVDVLPYDRTGDGNIDTIYAGDMNGNIYVFWNWALNPAAGIYEDTTTWQKRRIFTGRSKGGGGMILKFFQAPDVVMGTNYSYKCPDDGSSESTPLDYVLIGTGDREHPRSAKITSGSKQTYDRLYGIRHLFYDYNGCPSAVKYPLTDSNLTNVTNYTSTSYWLTTYASQLNWYIVFDEDIASGIYGEKVISQPIVFDGVAYFTTYIPPLPMNRRACDFNCNTHCSDADGWCKEDRCKPTELGRTRVYAVDYRNGNPVWSRETSEGLADRDGTPGKAFIKKDRWIAEGVGMSSQPTLIVTKDSPILLIATSKGVMKINTDKIKKRKKGQKSYWMIK